MAKPVAKPVSQPAAQQPVASKPIARTEVRNSPIPKTAAPTAAGKPASTGSAAKAVTHEQIARRAYEIWASGQGGSDFDNWTRAERELRGGR